jgi:hypothetical protein
VRSLRSVLALATFGLVLVTLVGFAISFELLSRANDGEIEELRQNDRRDVDADELFNALVDEEVGMRGYLVGGARELLEPYERGLAEEREIRTRLRAARPVRSPTSRPRCSPARPASTGSAPPTRRSRNGSPRSIRPPATTTSTSSGWSRPLRRRGVRRDPRRCPPPMPGSIVQRPAVVTASSSPAHQPPDTLGA